MINSKKNMHKLYETLPKLLKDNNIKPQVLSKETGVPLVTINRLMKDVKANPTISTLLPISRYFNININQLIGESNHLDD